MTMFVCRPMSLILSSHFGSNAKKLASAMASGISQKGLSSSVKVLAFKKEMVLKYRCSFAIIRKLKEVIFLPVVWLIVSNLFNPIQPQCFFFFLQSGSYIFFFLFQTPVLFKSSIRIEFFRFELMCQTNALKLYSLRR